jgi:hypothetical protein
MIELFGFYIVFRYEILNTKGDVIRRCDLHSPAAAYRSAKYESKQYKFKTKTKYSIYFHKVA